MNVGHREGPVCYHVIWISQVSALAENGVNLIDVAYHMQHIYTQFINVNPGLSRFRGSDRLRWMEGDEV